jgi:hypothetical protein
MSDLRVIEFNAAATASLKLREQALRDRIYADWEVARGDISTGSDVPVNRLFHTALAYASFWKRQAEKSDRLLNAALASDALTDEQRRKILATKYITKRDAKLLSDGELQLVDQYRTLSPAARAALRELVKWARAASPRPDRRRRSEHAANRDERDDVSSALANIAKPVITIDTDERPTG